MLYYYAISKQTTSKQCYKIALQAPC
uniref:Uncharacterized protein n=1 Tax=Arundo donax TaxID=35708 RepID=A0A0A8ZKA1_ARUDO